MKWAKLLYAAILIGMAVFYVLYIDSFALLMLICVAIAPVFLLTGLIWVHFASECRLTCGAASCSEGDSVPVTVILENHSPLFFPRAEAEVCLKHAFGRHPETLRLKFPVRASNNTRLTFYLHADYCGAVEISLKRIFVYDMFRIFRTKVRSGQPQASLLVLPKPVFLPLQSSAPPVDQPDSDRFADRPGDDPSEIFGIREYVPGDPVSRMHWKLSSRSDALLVKEFSMPIEKQILLYAEYVPGRSLADAQALLTLVYSLAYRMMQESLVCELAWCDGEKMVFCKPETEEHLEDSFRKLYNALYQMQADPDTVRDELGERLYSSVTVVSNHPWTEMLPLLEQRITANQKNLLLVTAEKIDLQSDAAEIRTVRPGQISLEQLIV